MSEFRVEGLETRSASSTCQSMLTCFSKHGARMNSQEKRQLQECGFGFSVQVSGSRVVGALITRMGFWGYFIL